MRAASTSQYAQFVNSRGPTRAIHGAYAPHLCLLTGTFEDAISDALRAKLPDAFRGAIRDALLVDPRLFDDFAPAEIRTCSCDAECGQRSNPVTNAPPGLRNRCKILDQGPNQTPVGECWFQIEPDRLNARPEGLEIILAEDEADPQFRWLATHLASGPYCVASRLSVPPGPPGPEVYDLPSPRFPIVVPVVDLGPVSCAPGEP